MKRIFRYFAGMAIVLAMFTSCSQWIDTDLNVDPDSPLDVPMKLLLPSIEAAMAYDIGGNETVRVSGMWMQHFQGVSRQSASQSGYSFGNSDPNNYWNSMYSGQMQDIVSMIRKAEAENSPWWSGIAKVLQALNLGMLTDFFGNIPYSEAFQGTDNLSPVFDTQESIYTAIQSLLDGAITDLQASENAVNVSGDYIYGGDVEAWLKAAYALKARYLIHTTQVNGDAAKTQALAALTNGFESSEDDMLFQYGTSAQSEASPLFQFMNERADIRMGATLIDYMIATNDPRLTEYADTNAAGDYVGGIIGVSTDAEDLSFPNNDTRMFRPDGVTVFISYCEQKFIEAEAQLGSDNVAAATAYIAAVEASLGEWGISDEGWLDANIRLETGATITLAKIYRQKWVALYGQAEIYNDWRRSDNEIGLALAQNAGEIQIPYRWCYPVEEQTYNENCPQGRDILSSMWWMGSADPSPSK